MNYARRMLKCHRKRLIEDISLCKKMIEKTTIDEFDERLWKKRLKRTEEYLRQVEEVLGVFQ